MSHRTTSEGYTMNARIISFVSLIVVVSFAGEDKDRLPEVSLNFEKPKVEIVKDTVKMVAPEIGKVVAISKVETVRTNPKYNPLSF